MISIMNSFWSESLSEIFKILLYIDGVIYNFVAVIFGLIIDLSSANFVTSDIVDMLLDRIYIIVGVLALFLITYALIKSLFDPNNAFKGKKSAVNVIKNMMIAIVLTVLMPTIFTYLYRFQSIIIDSNVISAIILGSGSSADGVQLCVRDPGNVSEDFLQKNPTNITCGDGYILLNFNAENSGYRNYVKMASNEMAFTALNTFLFAEDDFTELDNKAGGWEKVFGTINFLTNPFLIFNTVQNIYNDVNNINFADVRFHSVAYGNFMYITNLARAVSFGEGADVGTGEVTYYMVLSTICGLALLGLAVVTCVNLALRILKLFALEILSPIACFSMVIPDSKIFDRWLKETITTYLDLFFRLITFNLCILLFGQIHAITDSFEGRTGLLLDLFIIAGLLIFINEAPKMIKDILGIKTNDQKLLKRMFGGTVGSVLSGGAGFLGGLAGGALGASRAAFDPATKGKTWSKIRNVGMGAASGVGTGKNVAKAKSLGDMVKAVDTGVQNSVKANQKRNLNDARNGSLFSKEGIKNRVSNMGGYITGVSPTSSYSRYNQLIADASDIANQAKAINDIADKNTKVAQKKADWDHYKNSRMTREQLADNEVNRLRQMAQSTNDAQTAQMYALQADMLDRSGNAFDQSEYDRFTTKALHDQNVLIQRYKDEYIKERADYINKQIAKGDSEIATKYTDIKLKINENRTNEAMVLSDGSQIQSSIVDKYVDSSGHINFAAGLENLIDVINNGEAPRDAAGAKIVKVAAAGDVIYDANGNQITAVGGETCYKADGSVEYRDSVGNGSISRLRGTQNYKDAHEKARQEAEKGNK